MNTLLTAVVLVNTAAVVCSSVFLILAVRRAMRKARLVESWLRSYLGSADPATPSPFAQTVDAIGQVVGRAVVAQAKTTFMGEKSGAVRAERAAMNKAVQERFPWLAALEGVTPGISANLVRNPALLNLAASFLSKAGSAPAGSGPGPGQQPGNGSKPAEVQFKF